jgi:zinc protease
MKRIASMGLRARFWCRTRAALPLAWGLALAAAAAVAGATPPLSQPVPGVFEARLPNGFTLLVKPDRRAPTAVHMLWVKVGSMDEVDGTSGVAHVLEHMMFKGTPTVKPGEYSRRVAALGGRDNAFTSRDVTVYHQQVPAGHLEAVMALEADRFAHNRWDDGEFRREIEVVKEERRQRVDDQPRGQLFEALNATAWMAHPYRRPVIGWMADLDTLSPDDVRAFHRRWYVPANAAIVVAGDVEPAQVLQWALKHYGAVPAADPPVRPVRTEPAQLGARRVEVRAPAEQAYLAMAWPAPRLTDPEAADPDSQQALALLMLAAVLDGYEGARLGRALVQQPAGRRLADSAGAGYSGMGRGPAQFLLDATLAPGQAPEAVVVALRAEVARVAQQGVRPDELERVKNQWRAAEVYKLDALLAQASELGRQWVAGWPADASARLQASLRRITPEQVQAAAARWFADERLTLALLQPDREALARRQQAAAQGVPVQPRPVLRH